MMSANDAVAGDHALTSSCRTQMNAAPIASAPTSRASDLSSAVAGDAGLTVYASSAQAPTDASAHSEGIVRNGVYAYAPRLASRKNVHADATMSPMKIGTRSNFAFVERNTIVNSATSSARAPMQRVS